jgi:hypothetical protein
MYMHEAQSVPVVPDASLYPHVSMFFFILMGISPRAKSNHSQFTKRT